MRNLDLTALRSFVAVADTGGVTRAAAQVNLTQSAVSMQLKRLEEALDVPLIDRSARSVALSPSGEQLLSYARRMLELNDEAILRLTADDYEGEITLGVPHDIATRYIPMVLKRFNAQFPRMRIQLFASYTRKLLRQLEAGECDMILTTEDSIGRDGETLCSLPLVWAGAPDGAAWRQRPLPLAFEGDCVFRGPAQRALDAAGIGWQMAIESDSTRAIEAGVSADLAIHVVLEGMEPPYIREVEHGGGLPDLRSFNINLYVAPKATGPAHLALADLVRQVYGTIKSGAGGSQQPYPSPVAISKAPIPLQPVPAAECG
ncbi:LysR family transcriptional regulator [Actibacterium sp. 188UL27-1]|uniref:LysR family transcriptional regulator n=1 Tax=Actibacterium sp. 188UL27-1 TaxID=2786961 RepID=UPI001956B94F|nr:LysR family transcriptional regulator [Actibacterium sp. 188UL27-1]MBM7066675.1 LysR family transcriptional regulator [Actibacterium sp. 188UL27-1]